MNQTAPESETEGTPHFTMSLLHAAQFVTDQIEAALGGVGLSMAKQSALTKLAEAGEPLTLSELAARLSCVRSNITQLVDRLAGDGLVRRVDDLADRRIIRAELTQQGVQRQMAGAREMTRVQQEIAGRISVSDLGSLKAALKGLE